MMTVQLRLALLWIIRLQRTTDNARAQADQSDDHLRQAMQVEFRQSRRHRLWFPAGLLILDEFNTRHRSSCYRHIRLHSERIGQRLALPPCRSPVDILARSTI
jgi:hypothetical protein